MVDNSGAGNSAGNSADSWEDNSVGNSEGSLEGIRQVDMMDILEECTAGNHREKTLDIPTLLQMKDNHQ